MINSKNKLADIGGVIYKANKLIDTMLSRERRKENTVKLTLGFAIVVIIVLKYAYY